ncbi:two pore domain potassium channel family protein [Loktanella sp. 5RATIMAR09]|uniref:two pore domain potassium channel family protein n=1 Tax=Loktanella sp. 5RATIMAR09 TaxID=1225655 RepID=UPI0012ED8316|nr:two pore domain potassium channel family protein [Loktanella sp. 5RATIMAR09]
MEAGIYALAYMIGLRLGVGEFQSNTALSSRDILHLTLVTYTSLGRGDVVASGHLLFVSGLEALNGFLLISCSASFIFVQMSGRNKKI